MIKKIYAILCAISLMTAFSAFGMENTTQTKTTQATNRCDCCTKNIDDRNPIKTNHMLNRLEGTCSYLLCDTCQEEITNITNDPDMPILTLENIQKLYGNCKTCYYFDTFGIKQQWQPVTYPCDNCHQEKTVLNECTNLILDRSTNNHACLHILCKECENDISLTQSPVNNKIWWDCNYCSYFYDQHKQQCWLPKPKDRAILGSKGIRASVFKTKYPNRILSDITDVTILPQNPNNPAQHRPAPQNPNDPNQPTNTFVIDNKIKWLGIAGAATVVCYGAYKVYYWWKGDTSQEKDTDDEQEDWEKEEA